MKARTAVILVFATFGLVLFPLSILAHTHLYADGAFHLANLLESHTFYRAWPTLARSEANYLVQAGTVAAMRAGVSNVRQLSWIYGTALFYIPWCFWALACWRLLRAGMRYHAVIVAVMYTLLMLVTGWVAVSESHLAASVFVLTLAILLTSDLTGWRDAFALVFLGLLSLFLYEFWAVYFPACFAILLLQRRRRPAGNPFFFAALAVLCVLGTAVNIYAIMYLYPGPSTKDTMFFGENMVVAWPLTWRTSILFLVCIVGALGAMLFDTPIDEAPSQPRSRITALLEAVDGEPFLVVVGLVAALGLAVVFFVHGPAPRLAFSLRVLNLILPLLFVLFAGVAALLVDDRAIVLAPRRGLVYGLVALLLVTGAAWLVRAQGFSRYRGQIVAATQSNIGYVPIDRALPGDLEYGWAWTYPTDSLLFQAMQGTPIKSVLYNPGAEYQPFDPKDVANARQFITKAGIRAEATALRRN